MGALVASLAHELTQPLTVIQINTDMIGLVLSEHDAKLNQDTNIDKAMTGLRKANQRAVTIISTLRNMFGNGRKSISIFDFNGLVKEVLLLCQSTLQSHSIDLQVNLNPQPLHMTGDKSQMQQVILNLITNASEAFPASFQAAKRISVQTQMERTYIVLTVTDNGIGIEPEIEAMVFELLRTNKDTGMGIGLWLSKAIVESHQGKINFTTELNRGTTFRVELPNNSELQFF